ncbi:hypothetical protein EJ02DRAFT_309000, partial [Clathrospora elynae]
VSHLKDCFRKELLHSLQPAGGEVDTDGREEESAEDQGLSGFCKEMQQSIRKAFKSSHSGIVGRTTPEMIERRKTGALSNERPLYAGHKVFTIQEYNQKVVAVLYYLWRTHSQAKRPPYKLT